MAVNDQVADSGQDTGDAGDINGLSDAILAALKESDGSEKVSEAGDTRDGEDAAAAPQKEDAKDAKDASAKPNGEAQTFEAPKHWPKADREAFAAMAPENQQLIKRLAKDLEGGFTRRSQEIGDKARYADAVRGLLDESTRQQIARSGANELQYFGYLNQLQQYATRDPVGYLKWAMQNLGVSPDQLGFPKQQAPAQQPKDNDLEALLADPKVKQLEDRVAQLQGQWNDRQRAEYDWQQNQLYQHRQSLQSIAGNFRNQLDDNGQLSHPHFDLVRTHMGALMQSDPELARMQDGPEKMQAAYDMAVWARPDLRQALMQAESARQVAAAEKAREAQRARTITNVKSGNGVSTQSAQPQDLDSIIRAAMQQHGH